MKSKRTAKLLPSGQRTGAAFPRFGAGWRPVPVIPDRPLLRITGEVEEPGEIELDELAALPRREQVSDLHCVTTWTKTDLGWSGWRLSDLYEQVVVPRFRPRPEARYLVLFGLDGYRCSLLLEDALADDVLLADILDGEPLSPVHGAPLRVVSPHQYAYKSLKHLSGIALRREPLQLPLGLEHSRARVEHEERHAFLPAWVVRLAYRTLIQPTAYLNSRNLATRHFVGRSSLLDEVMPEAEHYELHSIWLNAEPAEVYRELVAVTGGEIRLLRPLLALRQLPARLAGRKIAVDAKSSVFENLTSSGFVRLAEESGREVVFGVVGRFWKPVGNTPLATVSDLGSFLAFEEPGYSKAAMSLLVRAEGRGSRVVTETRIHGTDHAAKQRFRRYWRLARSGSGLIRRSWLGALERRVTRRD